MRIKTLLFTLGLAMSAGSLVMAQGLDDWMPSFDAGSSNGLATLAQEFTAAQGYEEIDDQAALDTINEKLTPARPDSVFLPSGDLDPFVMAVLMLELHEPALERVRYRLRYGMVLAEIDEGKAPLPVSLIQLDRFNLGPAIREMVVKAVGGNHAAPAEEISDGPHTSWRLITRPIMGHSAMPLAISHQEISDEQAAAASCFGQSCTALTPVTDEAAEWRGENKTVTIPEGTSYEVIRNQVLSPAAATEILTADLTQGLMREPRESASDGKPFIEIVVETGLGQDSSLSAALHDNAMMDDSIKAYWELLQAMPGAQAGEIMTHGDTAYECRRGDAKFAPPASYCP